MVKGEYNFITFNINLWMYYEMSNFFGYIVANIKGDNRGGPNLSPRIIKKKSTVSYVNQWEEVSLACEPTCE